jgi:dipeptidyl-peptidase-4
LFVTDWPGQERQLTTDGGGTLSWGSAEFVAQEEMGRDQGHWWSPDDRYSPSPASTKARCKVVTRAAIGAEGLACSSSAIRSPALPMRWSISTSWRRTEAQGEGRSRPDPDIYLPGRLERGRQEPCSSSARAATRRRSTCSRRSRDRALEVLFSETSKTWINLHENLKPLKDGSLIWSSERSGSALYRWRRQAAQLTRGNWEVGEVEGVDEKARRSLLHRDRRQSGRAAPYWSATTAGKRCGDRAG